MDADLETNEELTARRQRVKEEVEGHEKKLNKMKPGGARTRKAMWCGCLRFALLTIKQAMDERGLKRPS
jgi:hypothetical protein